MSKDEYNVTIIQRKLRVGYNQSVAIKEYIDTLHIPSDNETELKRCVEFYAEELHEDEDSDKAKDWDCGCDPTCRCVPQIGALARKTLKELYK